MAAEQSVGEAVDAYIASTATPGVCVAAWAPGRIAADGLVVCRGVSDLLTSLPVDPDTTFAIGSLTKLFTSLLTAIAVIRGSARLDDPVARHLSQYPGFTPSPDLLAVDVVQLATHTSGMPDLAPGTDGASAALFCDGDPGRGLLDYWASYTAPSTGQPECFCYSNTGFVTLGFAVSSMFSRTGNRYDRLLAEEVTGPLGLTGTTAHPATMATGYVRLDGTNHPSDRVPLDLKSTGRDLVAWLRANLSGRPSGVLGDAIGLTQSPVGTYPACRSERVVTMGLGWQQPLIPGPAGLRHLLYKNGAVSGFSCALELLADDDLGVGVLTNQSHHAATGPDGEPEFDGTGSVPTPTTLAATVRTLLLDQGD